MKPIKTSLNGISGKAMVFLAVLGGCLLLSLFFHSNKTHFINSFAPTPWASIGGCGASSGSASGDMQLKWIGRGVTGSLIDAEVVMGHSVLRQNPDQSRDTNYIANGQNYYGKIRLKTSSVLFNLYYHPPELMDIKLTVPFLIKEWQAGKTGSWGDLSLDFSRKWGESASVVTALVFSFPTGYYDIMQDNRTPLLSEQQPGSGLYSASFRANYTIDRDWGIINIGGVYSAGLAGTLIEEYGWEEKKSRLTFESEKFEFARKGWGAINKMGVFTPDNLGFFLDVGCKTETVMHGFCISYSYPVAKPTMETWATNVIRDTTVTTKSGAEHALDSILTNKSIDTKGVIISRLNDGAWQYLAKTNMNQKAVPSVAIQYSIEKSDITFPMLLGFDVKLDYDDKFIFGGFAAGIGFKFPIY